MVAKGTYCAKGKLMYVNTRKKSVRKRIKLDKIQNINLVYLLDFQKLLDSVFEKKFALDIKINGLLNLLILDLNVLY